MAGRTILLTSGQLTGRESLINPCQQAQGVVTFLFVTMIDFRRGEGRVSVVGRNAKLDKFLHCLEL